EAAFTTFITASNFLTEIIIQMGDYERVRLVTLGGPGVGNASSFNTFSDKYKPTVEDLYSQEYDFGALTLKVDILDTAGDLQFPAMRRLSIATAHAFLIVYSWATGESFELAKVFFDEIQEQRGDFQETPIVLTGNKAELPLEKREVHSEEVSDWLESYWPTLKVKAIECSAKEDLNTRDVFRSFIALSKISFDSEDMAGLKRRSSAHAGSKSPATRASPCNISIQFLTEDSALSNRNKPRSRSLIRRCSKKVKQQVRDASSGPGDCQMS
ncbi:GTP-binding protein Di-Ras2, partial [Orchesella cincta]